VADKRRLLSDSSKEGVIALKSSSKYCWEDSVRRPALAVELAASFLEWIGKIATKSGK
jgi:hypothetical protein